MQKFLFIAVAFSISSVSIAQSDSSAFYLQKGLDEKAKGRRMESLKQLEKAYQFNNKNQQVVNEVAQAYLDLRLYAKAKEKFTELEKISPSAAIYKQLMNLNFNFRQFPDAIKYAELLKKADASEKVAYYIGKSYYEQENVAQAIKYLDAALKEDPTNADAAYLTGFAYTNMQNYKLAIPYFEKAIQLKPSETRWIYEMALVYYGMADEQNALKFMLLAGDKGYKKDNDYLQNLAIAYVNAGKFPEGIQIYNQLLEKRPTDISLLNQIAESCYDAKKYDDAITYYDKMLSIDKTNTEALYMIGLSFLKKGEKEKGVALMDKAIELDPSLRSLKQEKKMPTGGL
ncbi:MAG TPA: tetratricopeptide repeat protein [Flavisolibacter sp.]|nr:tetratricopeptide repeat protein [Flavisolibacter sp.]